MRVRRGSGWGLAALVLASGACDTTETVIVDGDGTGPAAPRNLAVSYYDRAVYVTWELAPSWDGESFRVYSKRVSDADYFLIADVTNCAGGLCSYTDTNVLAGVTYEYYVTAVDGRGRETSTEYAVEILVPQPAPPPIPGGMEVIALDGAAYLRWDDAARSASDFSFYRVYLAASDGTDYLLGETDSQGFLDELAENGLTYTYFVSSVDTQGHESDGSALAAATPRPDYHNEWVWDYFDVPELAGFRFRADENVDPVLDGDSGQRHFRLETDADGWWLVPGPGTEINTQAYETTALKCGPGSDAACTDLDVAPTSGYTTGDVGLTPQLTYVLRVVGDDGGTHYGVIRVTLLGFDQNGDAIMIFDWAYQLQPGNPELAPRPAGMRGRS
ncbi:MAG: hypothetical protein PVI57_10105 [Gemmatimonadota bacterium]|jgi:hypothetical protein